jgi:chromosomal replication initiation ATPase DnaA
LPNHFHLLVRTGKALGLSTAELTSGSRRKDVARARQIVAYAAVSGLGLTAGEVSRTLKVSRATISKAYGRGSVLLEEIGLDVKQLLG